VQALALVQVLVQALALEQVLVQVLVQVQQVRVHHLVLALVQALVKVRVHQLRQACLGPRPKPQHPAPVKHR
jgi:hypothetical protein